MLRKLMQRIKADKGISFFRILNRDRFVRNGQHE